MLNALPESGWVLPPDEALEALVSDGLIALEPVDVLLCDEQGGEGCPGWAEVLPADEPPCPECDRLLFAHESEARRWGRVRVQPDGVAAWVEARLLQEGAAVRLPGGMAWRVTLPADEVVVAVLDWSESSRWTRAEALASTPTVLVLAYPERYVARLRAGVVAVDLGALRAGASLADAFARALAMEVARPEPAPAWMPGCAVAPRVIVKVLGAHRLEVVGEEVRLDGLVVARGAVVARVVGWLGDRHAEDARDGKDPADHCWFTAQEIADEVGGTRDGVRKVIARFRTDARRVYLAESGVDLGEDGVVEFAAVGYKLAIDGGGGCRSLGRSEVPG